MIESDRINVWIQEENLQKEKHVVCVYLVKVLKQLIHVMYKKPVCYHCSQKLSSYFVSSYVSSL